MKKYIFKFFTPLINFDCSESEIIISKDLKICLASEDDKKILNDLKRDWSNIGISKWLIKIQLTKLNPESEPNIYLADARKMIEKTITLLRLYKEEIIGFNLIIQQYSDRRQYAFAANALSHYTLWAPSQSKLLKNIYKLNKNETQKIINFYKEYNTQAFSKLELAITYFNKSYIEPYPYRDGFIDCIIALENLFLKNTHQELSYKLSLRIAYLLGQNEIERKELYEFIREAYSIRSFIIHGEETKKISMLNDEYFLKIRNILRESIKYFIKNLGSWSSKVLDNKILDGAFIEGGN